MERQYLWVEHSDDLSFMLASLAVSSYKNTRGWVVVQYDEDGEPHRLGKTVFKTRELAIEFVQENLADEEHLPLIRQSEPLDMSLLFASYILALVLSVALAYTTENSSVFAATVVILTMVANIAALDDTSAHNQEEGD